MFCHKCGTEVTDGAGFCHRCGTKIVYANAEPQDSIEVKKQESPTESYSKSVPENSGPGRTSTSGSAFDKLSSKFKKWWKTASKRKKILTILGTLLVGGFALYFFVAFLREFGYLLFGIAVIGGFIITITTGSKEEKREARKTIVQMVIGGAIIIVITCIIVLKPDFVSNIFQPGANVRNAYLTQFSDAVTIEDAFNNFFDNGKWDTYKENNYSYITFSGVCEYFGERADVKITFKITGEKFIIDHLDVNGTTQNDLMLYGLLAKVYEDY